ncbi:MAG: CaiB/BaiF CoA transferase family protein, partial [Acidimicrobiales bacterium]
GGARTRRPPGAPAGEGGPALDGRPALEGLKVVDLTWVYAGPLATRVLAEHGATVVKIEGPGRPDAGRGGGGALAGDHGPEASLQFASMNADKLGLALDLNTPAGREVLVDLARWADVLVESYTPGVMDAWGLGADALHAANSELIVLSTSLMGQSGPLRGFAGFGNLAAAVCGFYELTGWPDRAPAGPFLAYTDYLAPRLTTAVLLAALERRAREGGGERIDFSQAEAAIHFLAPALVEHEVLGAARGRLGNDDSALSPHGVFPCAGDDAWVAVVCETDEQWRALTALVDGPALAGLGAEARLARRDELAALVAGWTGRRSAAEAEAALIEAGVPAHRVQNSGECWADPQLAHLGHWRRVPHPKHGSVVIEGPRVRLSRSPAGPHRAGPLLGEHNELVLRDLLGYDDDRIAQLIVDGALG